MDDNGCHDGLESQELTCLRDPDTFLASYENLHGAPRQACYYVATEFDDVRCRETPEVCERKFQLAWVKTAGLKCEMTVHSGLNAIHSVVASPSGFQKVCFTSITAAPCFVIAGFIAITRGCQAHELAVVLYVSPGCCSIRL